MRPLPRLSLGVTVCAVVVAGFIGAADAAQVSRQFNMPVTMKLAASATGCSNSPGPTITLQGGVAMAGLGLDLDFANNVKGTHTYTTISSMSLDVVPAGDTVQIPKQPVLGGVGGNPYIWIQLFDPSGNALTSEVYLGRCVQGQMYNETAFSLPVKAVADISTSDCSNNPGPYITLDGEMTIPGLNAKLIFRNSDNPVGGPHTATDASKMDVVLLPPGNSIVFPKQPVLGGVGGDPWIFAQFLQENGDSIGSRALLGRCVQLSQ